MDKKELLKFWYTEMAATKLKLKMLGFLYQQKADVPNEELDILLDRYRYLKKLIEEAEKEK